MGAVNDCMGAGKTTVPPSPPANPQEPPPNGGGSWRFIGGSMLPISAERLIAAISYGTYRTLYESVMSLGRFPQAVRQEGAPLDIYKASPIILQEYRRLATDPVYLPVEARPVQEALLHLIDVFMAAGTGAPNWADTLESASDATWAALESLNLFVFGKTE